MTCQRQTGYDTVITTITVIMAVLPSAVIMGRHERVRWQPGDSYSGPLLRRRCVRKVESDLDPHEPVSTTVQGMVR